MHRGQASLRYDAFAAFAPRRALPFSFGGAVFFAFTPERLAPASLVPALSALPPRSAVTARYYQAPESAGALLLAAKAAGVPVMWGLDSEAGEAALRVFLPYLHGVHLPARAAHRAPALRLQFPQLAFTCAAHDEVELRRAEASRADAVFFSPVYPTRTHPGAPALGLARFAACAAESSVPLIALGGVAPESLEELSLAGAAGAAGIGLFFGGQKG